MPLPARAPLRLAFPLGAMLALLVGACGTPRPAAAPPHEAPAVPPPPAPGPVEGAGRSLPLDPDVRRGVLENGLRYYVLENAEPRDRAELRLVVDAGSVLEDDDQRGLAHFVEHMAFNGTERFPEHALVDFLEGLGMRFGPDLNAYTSFDETVYMLQVPTDSAALLATGLDVLREWAGSIAFDPEEVERERGVVLEEWRLGQGAQARMWREQFPVLLRGSAYADRLPIGLPETIRGAPREALLRYYRDWYRPDLMAVVAVGDFDAGAIEAAIRERFASLPLAGDAPERPAFATPPHDETLVSVAQDPEATNTVAMLITKRPPSPVRTDLDVRRGLVEELFQAMLNARYRERTQAADPPFVYAAAAGASFARGMDGLAVQGLLPPGGLEAGLEAVLTEVVRARRHGFAETELARQKAELLRAYERAYRERATTPSRSLAGGLVDHALTGEAYVGADSLYALAEALLPSITLDDVNALAAALGGAASRVLLVQAPVSEPVPEEPALRALLARVEAAEVAPYDDAVSAEPLLEPPAAPGQVITESRYEDGTGVTEWRLSNGVRVLVRPTDFRSDEVRLRAFSPGGLSLVADSLFTSALVADLAVELGGVGAFSATELEKKLAGTDVGLSPYVTDDDEGFTGAASPDDLETLFQLLHLHVVAPRADSVAFRAWQDRAVAALANRAAQPEVAFRDTLAAVLSQHHPRRRPFTAETARAVDLAEALAVYRDRLGDASDLTVVLVGNVDVEAVRPLVARYLATLPATGRAEAPRDLGIRPPEGVVERVVRRGVEPKAQVALAFSGAMQDSRQRRFLLGAAADALQIRLRETLREDRGGVYGVGVQPSVDRHTGRYLVHIGFGCDPGRVDELVDAVFGVIEEVKAGPDPAVLGKVREQMRREQELGLRDNGYWLNALVTAYRYDESPMVYLDRSALIATLTPDGVRRAAASYLRTDHYVKVVLLPEDAPAE